MNENFSMVQKNCYRSANLCFVTDNARLLSFSTSESIEEVTEFKQSCTHTTV